MYVSKILDEQVTGRGQRRLILERPASENTYVVKAVFRVGNEAKAKELFDYLLHMHGNRPPQRGKTKEADNGEIHEI